MMIYTMVRWEKIKTIACIRMPITDSMNGKYVGVAFLNFISFWKKGNRAPSKKQLQINVKIGNQYYQMLPHFYDFVKLMSRQSRKARLNSRVRPMLTILDEKTWDYWLKFKEKGEEKLRKNKK